MIAIPAPPTDPERLGTGSSTLRYEDVAQDGRLRLEGIWPPIGPIIWGRMPLSQGLARQGARGIRAVLTHVVLEGLDEPVSVRHRAEHEVRYDLAHTVDESGAVNRLLFDIWLSSFAPRAEPGLPALPADGPRVRFARAYGRHVFTKPAAPPGQHRVVAIDDPMIEGVPPKRAEWQDARVLLELPPGARALDRAARPDVGPVVFGLSHTDGNQHVNFLAYPRLAEEAALRRAAELGRDPRLLARRAEVGYRKPCFAGDRMRMVVRAYENEARFGAVVAFVEDREDFSPHVPQSFTDLGKVFCIVRVELTPTPWS